MEGFIEFDTEDGIKYGYLNRVLENENLEVLVMEESTLLHGLPPESVLGAANLYGMRRLRHTHSVVIIQKEDHYHILNKILVVRRDLIDQGFVLYLKGMMPEMFTIFPDDSDLFEQAIQDNQMGCPVLEWERSTANAILPTNSNRELCWYSEKTRHVQLCRRKMEMLGTVQSTICVNLEQCTERFARYIVDQYPLDIPNTTHRFLGPRLNKCPRLTGNNSIANLRTQQRILTIISYFPRRHLQNVFSKEIAWAQARDTVFGPLTHKTVVFLKEPDQREKIFYKIRVNMTTWAVSLSLPVDRNYATLNPVTGEIVIDS